MNRPITSTAPDYAFLLGLIFFIASLFSPERLFPILSFSSGIFLVTGFYISLVFYYHGESESICSEIRRYISFVTSIIQYMILTIIATILCL